MKGDEVLGSHDPESPPTGISSDWLHGFGVSAQQCHDLTSPSTVCSMFDRDSDSDYKVDESDCEDDDSVYEVEDSDFELEA
jgi:hypothetical protein